MVTKYMNEMDGDAGLSEAIELLQKELAFESSAIEVVHFKCLHNDSSDRRLSISKNDNGFKVEYSDRICALRALGLLLAGQTDSIEECTSITNVGIMLDCSRNAVFTVSTIKKWLCRMALLGYNTLYLYLEDVYVLPGEEYFGRYRGAYTQEELKEIDDCAAVLGIQVVPCIQTLGHLEQVLRWSAYKTAKDTSSVLLVDSEKTYALIEKMISFWEKTLRSRRIHIGMDETHDLGRGQFRDLNGHEPAIDIFSRHIEKVVAICRAHGLAPMIWSDMYFRLNSKTNDYYDHNYKRRSKSAPGGGLIVRHRGYTYPLHNRQSTFFQLTSYSAQK